MSPRSPRLPRRSKETPEHLPGPVEGSIIRPATQEDIATIVALRALLFEATGAPPEVVSDTAWQQDAARWLQLRLASGDAHVVVAEAHGTVVSCVMGQVVDLMPSPHRSGPGGRVSNVATFPRHRRLGFTGAIIEAVLTWFREETDVEVVSVGATEDGRSIYERFGFEEAAFPEMRLRIDRTPAEEEGE
ncbi:GNAT family N-acetyltransferase [Janibacter corallicola]|uniref:GNAT family N-acetyltransferase n=1 Tax=Janibacter corallicola TaxID=415212 RepID=UPI0008379F3E|nr:GNAT family N-acetyltransferase [Janibacter corallicola]